VGDHVANDILVDQLSLVISHSTAPAFLLGAVAAFVSVLISRLNRIVDRCNVLTTIKDEDAERGRLKSDIPRLKRRAKLMNRAIEFAVVSGIFTTLLVLVAFGSAFIQFRHEYGAAVLFIFALSFFTGSLINLWLEVRIALNELDYYI
jgi:hypothetical protein